MNSYSYPQLSNYEVEVSCIYTTWTEERRGGGGGSKNSRSGEPVQNIIKCQHLGIYLHRDFFLSYIYIYENTLTHTSLHTQKFKKQLFSTALTIVLGTAILLLSARLAVCFSHSFEHCQLLNLNLRAVGPCGFHLSFWVFFWVTFLRRLTYDKT